MTDAPTNANKRYTYKDYLSWDDLDRWELIEGIPYNMTLAPGRAHQKVSGAIFNSIYNYLQGKSCEVYAAPFDVRLPKEGQKDEDITTIVQPDIVVICDKDKLDEKGCKGSPDMIVEITSPSTVQHDLKDKFYLYEKVGVKEYWIVDPIDKTLMVFKLNENGEYKKPHMYVCYDKVRVDIFQDLEIDLNDIFAD